MTAAVRDEIVLRLPREVARFLEPTLYDVGEHIAGGRESVPGPPELERELAALMRDIREARGESHPYDADRPLSARPRSATRAWPLKWRVGGPPSTFSTLRRGSCPGSAR
jgi:hypothetical protein